MVIEMASAFLRRESVLESSTRRPADLQQQIGIMGGWLLDAAQGKSTGEPPAGLRADLSQQIGALQLRAQVAKEILANLQYRSEEHTSELQSRPHLVCRLLLEKKNEQLRPVECE